MLTTVRARILAFALLSVAAVAGLTFIAWMIIAKAEHTSQALVGESLEQSWMLVDLEQDHRLLQDLAYKIKAQLLLWDEIDPLFTELERSIPRHWQRMLLQLIPRPVGHLFFHTPFHCLGIAIDHPIFAKRSAG